MAIRKSKTLDNGVSGNYWKIVQTTLNVLERKCSWMLQLFLDETYKNSKGLEEFKVFYKSELSSVDMNKDLRALGYTTLKEIQYIDLEDAEDV